MKGLKVAAFGLALALAVPFAASAAPVTPPAQQKTQVPGYYRMMVGDFEITALYDGYIDVERKILKGVSAEDVQSLLARMFLAEPPRVQTAVNAFLVHTGSRLVLIDAGSAKCFGPTLGGIADNIRAAGYDPAQIDTVVLTHLHPDHACGLVTAEGKAAFPNARLRVAEAEAHYWLDEDAAAKAPEAKRGFFKMARDAVAPYDAAGRLEVFSEGEVLLPGITAVALHGHTPGHTGFLISSRDKSLLAWGDVIHSHAVQFARPEVAVEFDVDNDKAVEARRRVLADAARDKLWVAGAHLPFPGIGHVRAEGQGYAWVPVEFSPIRTDR